MAPYPVVSRGIGRKPPSHIEIVGDTAVISLTKGLCTTVDLADVDRLAGYRWVALINGQTGHAYAIRYERGKAILLHRELLDFPRATIDHVDGDGLNNRRANIREATFSQNMANKVLERRNKLGIKGVSVARGRFKAVITPNGKKIHLGTFDTAEEAAAAYRGASRALWGDFARSI